MLALRIRTRDQANLTTGSTCFYNTIILNATQKDKIACNQSYDKSLYDNAYKCEQKAEFIQFVAVLADVKWGQCWGERRFFVRVNRAVTSLL
jgi:hypothetical protein